jgi:ABC-type phosphate transport system ATPase subunit
MLLRQLGELARFGVARQFFEKPQQDLTKNYVTGHFG